MTRSVKYSQKFDERTLPAGRVDQEGAMSQRNSQNPVRKEKSFRAAHDKYVSAASEHHNQAGGMLQCPECKADVPPKPGFRIQSLKCPKCGAGMRK